MQDDRIKELMELSRKVSRRILGLSPEAQDVAQNSLLKLLESPVQPDNSMAWINRVTYHGALQSKKREKRFVSLSELPEPPLAFLSQQQNLNQEAQMEYNEKVHALVLLCRIIERHIASLSPEERLVLKHYRPPSSGFSNVAQRLQVKPATVRQRYFRALRKIRRGVYSDIFQNSFTREVFSPMLQDPKRFGLLLTVFCGIAAGEGLRSIFDHLRNITSK